MDVLLIIAAALAGLALGALVAWLYTSRDSAAAKQTVDTLRLQLDGIVKERDEARTNCDAASRELAALQADARNFEQRMKDLSESKDALIAQFRAVGDQLLEKAHKDFLEKAGERFSKADQQSETKLKELLAPVQDTLKRYENNLTEIEKARNASYGELKQAVLQLSQGNDQVRKEAQRLANVMTSSPKFRGDWGEEHLRKILEMAGLAENIDFALQTTVEDGDKKLRPDCIINLPGDRCIVVDVKNVWSAFDQSRNEEDPQRQAQLLKQHADAMQACAVDLSRKGYWQKFDRSPDFVIMFIPGEHILSAAAERAPDMISSAFRSGVIIASTINMLALAKFMAGMWRQEALAAQAKEIAALGKELHSRIQTMGAHVVGLGRNLRLATDAYDSFIGSLDSKVLTQAKRFEELKVADGNKPIIDPQRIDYTPKVSAKLSTASAKPPVVSIDDPLAPRLEKADEEDEDK